MLNETVAYFDLAAPAPGALSERSRQSMTCAMCGVADFGSFGIVLGGMATMLPEERRAELAQLDAKSIAGGLLATCATAALAGTAIWRRLLATAAPAAAWRRAHRASPPAAPSDRR